MAPLAFFFVFGGGFFVPIVLMVFASKRVGHMLSVVGLSLLTVPFLYGQHRYNQWQVHTDPLSSGGIPTAEILLLLLSGLIAIWAFGLIIASRKE
jgi:hypothetical protein